MVRNCYGGESTVRIAENGSVLSAIERVTAADARVPSNEAPLHHRDQASPHSSFDVEPRSESSEIHAIGRLR